MKLDQFLKWKNLVSSGGEAKTFIYCDYIVEISKWAMAHFFLTRDIDKVGLTLKQ